MGQSIFKGWLADNDPRYSNNTVSVCVGTSFSLAGRPTVVAPNTANPTIAEQNTQKTGNEERTKEETGTELTTAQTGDSTIPDASIQAKPTQ